eukprot:5838793-Prymnesium_polylepis.1
MAGPRAHHLGNGNKLTRDYRTGGGTPARGEALGVAPVQVLSGLGARWRTHASRLGWRCAASAAPSFMTT